MSRNIGVREAPPPPPPKVDEELVRQINDALFQSGERERLKQLVREKLQAAGWFDRIRAEADRELASRNIDSVSPQELSLILAPKAEELVPSTLRAEIQEEIRRFLEEHVHIA